jgi:hypothetical protein
LYVLQLIWIIEEVGSSNSASDFKLESAWFISLPRHQLIWLWFFVIFLSSCVQMSWIVHDCFYPYDFQFLYFSLMFLPVNFQWQLLTVLLSKL